MDRELLGIHHVTAIAGDPQRNVDFYTRVLGLRLVKATVNFDDPGTYHLYYGDRIGRPGTLLTFFAWPQMERGRKGTRQATLISFIVPYETLPYWGERLEDFHIAYEGPISRFDDRLLTFFDPDDLQIELVGRRRLLDDQPERTGPVPPEFAIRRIGGVTFAVEDPEPTASFLADVLGFRLEAANSNRFRYLTGEGDVAGFVDLLVMPGLSSGRVAVGNVHHVAWRTPNDAEQAAWGADLRQGGWYPTGVLDRRYFRSIYFREPGGVLLEIATDGPGFTVDEAPDLLGASLALPPWLEERRAELEGFLPPLRLPGLLQQAQSAAT